MNLPAKATDFGVVERKGKIVTSSRNVARIFGKRHDSVLRDIKNIIGGLHKIVESGKITSGIITEDRPNGIPAINRRNQAIQRRSKTISL